jgi:4-amino-4-deoxy-L-arabinose transferase-like glycosyltransferase
MILDTLLSMKLRFNNYPKRKLIFILFLLAFLIRLISIFILADLRNPQKWEFGILAQNLYLGTGYYFNIFFDDIHPILPSAYMPPGLAYLYLVVYEIFGLETFSSNLVILILNSVFAAISVAVIYSIGYFIYDKTVAFISALVVAVNPIFIFSTINFNSIIIFQLLLGLIFLYFLKSFYTILYSKENGDKELQYKVKEYDIKSVIMLSVSIGLLYYFRAELPALMLVMFVFLVIRRFYKPAVIIFIVSLLILAPWTIRNYFTFGKVVPVSTSFGLNLHKGHNYFFNGSGWLDGTDKYPIYVTKELGDKLNKLAFDSTFEVKASDVAFDDAMQYVKNNPGTETINSLRKIYYLWIIDVNNPKSRTPVYFIPWLLTLALFVYGLILTLRSKQIRKGITFLIIYLVFLTVITVIFFSVARYQVQASYIMIPTAVYGLVQLYYRLKKKPV